jgi:hypothetical protein
MQDVIIKANTNSFPMRVFVLFYHFSDYYSMFNIDLNLIQKNREIYYKKVFIMTIMRI